MKTPVGSKTGPSYRVAIEEVPDTLIASVTEEAPRATVGEVVQEAFGTLGRAIGAAGAFGSGAPGLIVHEMDDDAMTIEVFMPITHAFVVPGGVTVRTLEGGKVAVTVHTGPYDRIGAAYGAVTAWLADHREMGIGPPRERYLNDPHTVGEGAARTRVEFPIA